MFFLENRCMEYLLSESELRVRKLWLRLLVVSTGISMFYMLLLILEGVDVAKVQSTPEIIGWFLGNIVKSSMCALSGWIIYHCAYKNPGTKLLTLGLLLFPFSVVGEIKGVFEIFQEFGAEDSLFLKFSIFAFWLVSFAISMYYFVCSYRLRAINKKIKRYKASLQPQVACGDALLNQSIIS